jgi:hypothetical protein
VKRLVRALAGIGLAGVLSATALGAAALHALAPRPGEWRTTLRWGPFRHEASVPTLIRWGTHPLALARLDGHTLRSRAGAWHLKARPDGSIEATCAPCAVQLDALGAQPLALGRVRITLAPRGADRFDGTLWLGGAPQWTEGGVGATELPPVVLPWRAELKADALKLQAELVSVPLARMVALLGDAVPEAPRAQIDGRFALKLQATVGDRGLQFQRLLPRLDDVAVAGLGTQALIDADPGQRCRPQPAAGGRIEGWIQNAVVAAEDQRFAEHPGYELDAWLKVWNSNQADPEALQGASTITQQLAKLLYTGDDRSAARKLREWLYAVEMERTLGKGRILQLYLAVLPWGDGICGAEAAARHHLGKPAIQLKPHEAAWLASLLVNPDQQLRRWAQHDAAARERAMGVLKGMRRLPRERRESELEAFAEWRPPIGRSLLSTPLATGTSPATHHPAPWLTSEAP